MIVQSTEATLEEVLELVEGTAVGLVDGRRMVRDCYWLRPSGASLERASLVGGSGPVRVLIGQMSLDAGDPISEPGQCTVDVGLYLDDQGRASLDIVIGGDLDLHVDTLLVEPLDYRGS